MVGMSEQLFVKIKHVAVRVAFTENRNKPENVALKAVALAIGMDESLASQLRGP